MEAKNYTKAAHITSYEWTVGRLSPFAKDGGVDGEIGEMTLWRDNIESTQRT